MKRGRKSGPALSQQVRALIGEGNQAYVDNDVQETMRVMQEVIRIEPRAASAWSVLANCYNDMAQPEKALRLRIMGAHLHHDADEWDSLARQSRSVRFTFSRLSCSSQGTIIGRWASINKLYIVMVRCIVSIRLMSTLSGIELHWQKRWVTRERSVSHISQSSTR
jgi:general transcription factor 3C polypeptide 3 (transcription factor C subunit 4)